MAPSIGGLTWFLSSSEAASVGGLIRFQKTFIHIDRFDRHLPGCLPHWLPGSPGAGLPLSSLLYFSPGTDSALLRNWIGRRATGSKGNQIVPGKKYLTEQAATFLKFAKAATDPDVAAGFLDKAADLSARSEAAPDASPKAPDVEQPEG